MANLQTLPLGLTKSQWVIVAVAIAILNAWPFAFFHFAGDIFIHYFHIDCYGRALWQGNFLATWCSTANTGYGSPAPMFYFPLPYLFTSLVYPLTHIGMSTFQLYVIGVWAANIFTILGCLLWLRRHMSAAPALVLACIYLWFPYRLEVLTFRFAYAELWLLALLPYLMFAVDKLKCEPPTKLHYALFTILFSATIIGHVPGSVAFYIALLLMFLLGYIPIKRLTVLIVSGSLALLCTAPWWLNIYKYSKYISGNSQVEKTVAYANRSPTMHDLTDTLLAIGIAANIFMAVVFVCIAIWLLSKRNVRKHVECKLLLVLGLCCSVIGYYLYLPWSSSVWEVLHSLPVLGEVMFPWRMQILSVIGSMLILIGYVRLQYQSPSAIKPAKKGDLYAFASVMFLLSGIYILQGHVDVSPKLIQRGNIGHIGPYQTIWTDGRYNIQHLIGRVKSGQEVGATFISGSGSAKVVEKSNHHITIEANVEHAGVIKLEHFYFPIWHAVDVNGGAYKLAPAQDGSGFMLLDIPSKGQYTIRLENKASLF